jgi:hypothetical protein
MVSDSFLFFVCFNVFFLLSLDKKLDPAFTKNVARSSWGRNDKVGSVRTIRLSEADINKKEASLKEADTNGLGRQHSSANLSPTKSFRTITGSTILDPRSLPKLSATALTVKHSGMSTFSDSVSLSKPVNA